MNSFSKKFNLSTISQLIKEDLIPILRENSILLFFGPLGAGKTTLVRELLSTFKVNELITSPTFTYLNIYTTQSGKRIFHFDLYRLNSLDEFLALGFDEYLYENSLILIEWPEIITSFLASDEMLKKRICFLKLDYGNALDFRQILVEFN